MLAAMRDRRTKSSASTIASSLEGTWREEHLFALKQALERLRFLRRAGGGLRSADPGCAQDAEPARGPR